MAWWRGFTPYDGYILAGLAVVGLSSLYVDYNFMIHDHFHTTFDEAATQPKTQYITQDTEDSLPLDTLTSLLEHYNFSIRETAAKIVCDRAVNDDDTLRRLLWGVAQPDYKERMASLRALAMLTDNSTLARLHTREGVAAFIRSLQHCVGDSEDKQRTKGEQTDKAGTDDKNGESTDNEENEEKGTDKENAKGTDTQTGPSALRTGDSMIADVTYDEYHLRDMSEKLCLMFLAQMADLFGADLMVRAGIVEKWLARQRWLEPPVPENAEALKKARIDSFAKYLKYRDNRIAFLCEKIMLVPAGWKALEDIGLVEEKRVRPPKLKKKKRVPLALVEDAGAAVEVLEVVEDIINGETPELDRDFTPANPSPLRAELRVVNGNVVSGEDEAAPAAPASAAPAAPAASASATASTPQQAARRPTSQNTREEQRIRRQHREAMVLNDGTRPLRRDDIFERESE